MTNNLTPRLPAKRPLWWSDAVLNLQETILDLDTPPVYIVGGAVRDAYLHRPIKDVDLATPGDAIKLARQLANHLNGDIFVMDKERDVARVFLETAEGRLTIDVAHFRGDDLLADLLGRDFTLNAIATDLRGYLDQFIDPLNAEADLERGILRRCTPISLQDDPIRALRGVRQSVQLGLRIEPETLKDIRAHVHRLMDTSPERVRDELFNLLLLDKPAAALRIADTVGLLTHIFPELVPLHGLTQAKPHITDIWQHTLLVVEKLQQIITAISPRRTDATAAVFDLGMFVIQIDRYRWQLNTHLDEKGANERGHRAVLLLAALLHNAGKGILSPDSTGDIAESVGIAETRADALRLSNPEKKRLLTAIAHYRRVLDTPEFTVLEKHRFWYTLGVAGVDVCLLALADYLGTVHTAIEQDIWLKLVDRVRDLFSAWYDLHDSVVKPPSLVNGNDLMTHFNLAAGPIIGTLLDAIREAQVVGDVTTADEAYALAGRLLGDSTR
jgi:tRNA nucleotidyltransferase/poly(A) polymerase